MAEEFKVVHRVLTPENFFCGFHFSRRNYTQVALTDKVDHQGKKPTRKPKSASEAMIEKTEKRLGVRLPKTLKDIYFVQNGGSVESYFIPVKDSPRCVYEDWMGAFAHDYDVLNPLEELSTLYDSYMEYFDPEYSDPQEKENWISGSEKLIVLCARSGYGTALDYRNSDDPGVLLFDHNGQPSTFEVVQFETFDEFLLACRLLVDEFERESVLEEVFGEPPNSKNPDLFWGLGGNGTPKAITDEAWEQKGRALGVQLPKELLPYYKVADGGHCIYRVCVRDGVVVSVFPKGPYIKEGTFLPLSQWLSLADLSDRLDFTDNRKTWNELYSSADKLIVISAAFDSALLLDYRTSSDPKVISIADLDKPDGIVEFPSLSDFLSRLRRFGFKSHAKEDVAGDLRISARKAHVETFWKKDHRSGISPKLYDETCQKWSLTEHGLPTSIQNIYKQQNGGQVIYRWAPPQVMTSTNYRRPDVSAPCWQDVFPKGLLPVEEWESFIDWRLARGVASKQALSDFTDCAPLDGDQDDENEDIVIRLIVVGVHDLQPEFKLTLLDMSEDFFKRKQNLMTLEYNKNVDRFEVVWGPIHCDNIYSGLFESLRAIKEDL